MAADLPDSRVPRNSTKEGQRGHGTETRMKEGKPSKRPAWAERKNNHQTWKVNKQWQGYAKFSTLASEPQKESTKTKGMSFLLSYLAFKQVHVSVPCQVRHGSVGLAVRRAARISTRAYCERCGAPSASTCGSSGSIGIGISNFSFSFFSQVQLLVRRVRRTRTRRGSKQ